MNILICDDHKIICEGIRQILQQYPLVTFIKEVNSAAEAFASLTEETFDIIILDISLPDENGLDVLQAVKTKYPTTKVIILSTHPQEQYAIRALQLGASAYLCKSTGSDELILAIKRISEGGKYISGVIAESIALNIGKDQFKQKHEKLSFREFEIMLKIVKGDSLNKIGEELFISSKTVSTYRSRIMFKMNFTKNTELTRYCLENKLI